MLDWLFNRRELRELRDEVQRRRASYTERETRIQMLIEENRKQRILIDALRDVNRSLDERCNAMEKGNT
jgi:hypothetical protein